MTGDKNYQLECIDLLNDSRDNLRVHCMEDDSDWTKWDVENCLWAGEKTQNLMEQLKMNIR